MTTRTGHRACGLTLVESLLAALVLAMVVGAILMPFTAGAQASATDLRQTLAVHLAGDLMEEILSKPYHDPNATQEGESGRFTWDDMTDYHGFAEAVDEITSLDGTVVTDPAAVGLSRRAFVEDTWVAGQDTGNPATFLRVTVQVCYHGAPIVTVRRLVYAND